MALQPLSEAAADYGARLVGDELLQLGKLSLFLRVRQIQVMAREGVGLYIGLFDTADGPGQTGICVTCVGLGTDAESAAREAAATWALSVLPVLARWRGDHSCYVSTATLEVPGSPGVSFEVLQGPVLEKGEHDGGEAGHPTVGAYLEMLGPSLRGAKLRRRKHWLECFASRSSDGSIDATCRLDNKDWNPGRKLLEADVRTWPGSTPSMHSRRQFMLLVPQGGEAEEPEPRSFWGRLFGR